MSDVLAHMDALIVGWGPDDRRTLFLRAYRSMSMSMTKALDDGEFGDREWVDLLLRRFADYYFEAVDSHELDPAACPAVWQVAFEGAARDDVHPLRVLFLGINAHINYDLALCVAEVLQDWPDLDPDTRVLRHHDYERVDGVIRHTMDGVQNEVVAPVAPGLGLVDRIVGPLDEFLFAGLIANWRDDSWSDALELLESSDAEKVRAKIEAHALETADRILHLGPE